MTRARFIHTAALRLLKVTRLLYAHKQLLLSLDMASYWAPTSYKQQQQQQQQLQQQQQSESALPAEIEEFLQTQQIYPEPDFPQSQPASFEDVTTTTATTATKPAGAKKREREEKLGLADYAAVSKKLRRLSQSQLQTIGDWQPLANCKHGEVLVVDSCEEKQSAYGKMSLLQCKPTTPEDSGKRIICPARFLDASLYPCIMIYFGMVEMLTSKTKDGVGSDNNGKKAQQKKGTAKSKQPQLCHALRRYGGLSDVFANEEEMVAKANELRQMSIEDLRKTVEVKRLRDFPAGTVLVYFGHRKVASTFSNSCGFSHVVGYQAVVNGKHQTGEVYVPERHVKTLEERPVGVAVYKGIKHNTSGAEFYDLEFIADDECKRLIGDK